MQTCFQPIVLPSIIYYQLAATRTHRTVGYVHRYTYSNSRQWLERRSNELFFQKQRRPHWPSRRNQRLTTPILEGSSEEKLLHTVPTGNVPAPHETEPRSAGRGRMRLLFTVSTNLWTSSHRGNTRFAATSSIICNASSSRASLLHPLSLSLSSVCKAGCGVMRFMI